MSDDEYKELYLKYKMKYIDLKSQNGGGIFTGDKYILDISRGNRKSPSIPPNKNELYNNLIKLISSKNNSFSFMKKEYKYTYDNIYDYLYKTDKINLDNFKQFIIDNPTPKRVNEQPFKKGRSAAAARGYNTGKSHHR